MLWDDHAEYHDQGTVLRTIPLALKDHKPIVITSGHALGKDFLSGAIPLWFQCTRYPAKSILTGPTDRQVKEITWNELEGHYSRQKMPLAGKLTTGKLEWDSDHFILAFTTQKPAGDATSNRGVGKAQGFHSPNILIIVTEAQAIPEKTWEQIDGLTTSENALLIMIGNPLATTGRFARSIQDPAHHHVINLDCENSPNVRAGETIIPGMVSRQWVEDKRRVWFSKDANHPLWLSKVKGLLPKSPINTFFSHDMIVNAAGRKLRELVCKRATGADIARYGDDETVIYTLESGKGVIGFEFTAKMPTTDAAGRCFVEKQKHQSTLIGVDADGLGSGVIDMLREMHESPLELHGSAKPEDEIKYHNLRAQMYGYTAEQIETGHMNLPDDPQLHEELEAVKYFFDSKGRMQAVEKDDIKEELGRSPDRADAFVIAVWTLHKSNPVPKKDRYAVGDYEEVGAGSRGYMVA